LEITNEETDLLIRLADTIRYVKAQRIRRIGHIVRMDKEMPVKRVTKWRPFAVRNIGRPGTKWEDGV
jgi:hypothetical protein